MHVSPSVYVCMHARVVCRSFKIRLTESSVRQAHPFEKGVGVLVLERLGLAWFGLIVLGQCCIIL